MGNALRVVRVALVLATAVVLVGCGRRAEVITAGYSKRRVGPFDVEGDRIAYVWYPAQHISTQGHLVVLNTATGREIELDEDLNGPMALSRGRVAWWNARLRDDEGNSDINIYDIEQGTLTGVAHGKVRHLDLDGDQLVWEEAYQRGSDIILLDLADNTRRPLSTGGREGRMMHRNPVVRNGVAVWEAYDRGTRKSTISVVDIASGDRADIEIPYARPKLSVSPPRLVYALKEGDFRQIHLYDIPTNNDTVVAAPERLTAGPYIEGNSIAWCEHIPREDFKGIPGQPLMDETEIWDVFVYDIKSTRKRRIAEGLLCTGGRIAVHAGRVYLNVYREYPPPGASNLVVSVDLYRW